MKRTSIAFLAFLMSNVDQTTSTSIKMDEPEDEDGSVDAANSMVKMCLFYPNPSGHARSDPIINQQCASGHVHTFYGPQNFHPNTSYEDIRDTPAKFSSTPYVENQSLYWHPSIYEVTESGGTKTYTRVDNLETSPYYRWDNSVAPRTEAFPPGFRMIAHSNDDGANLAGETGRNMLTECCNIIGDEEEDCQTWDKLHFPTQTCDFLGIAMAMPTCWSGTSLGDDNDHKSHMAYTTNGEVNGPCPPRFPRRLPQVQLFVRIIDKYKGGTYQLSNGMDMWHVDFFNGWQEGKLEEIIDNCEPDRNFEAGDFNPPCGCTPDDGSNFLTANTQVAGSVCDSDVRKLIIDEATDVTNQLPSVACEGSPLIAKSWSQLDDSVFECRSPPSGSGGGSADENADEPEDEMEDETEEGDSFEGDGGSADEASDELEDETENDGGSEEEASDEMEDADFDSFEEDGGSEDEASDEMEDETEEDGGSEEEASDEMEDADFDSFEEDGGSEDEASDELEDETEEDGGSEEEASDEMEDADFDSFEEDGGSEDEAEDEVEEEDSSDFERASSATNKGCDLVCWDQFQRCETSIDQTCETYYGACKNECFEAVEEGDIDADELDTCLNEWCMEDKEGCYDEAQARCDHIRQSCVRNCR